MSRMIAIPTRSASVSKAFQFADLAIRSADVGSESEVFLRTIQIVRNDLSEVERLVAVVSVRTKLAQTPERLPWIRSCIENTTSALEEIGRWVDCGSTGQYRNVLDQSQKLRHTLNDRERLADRKSELMACHQQLSNVLSFLNRLEDLPSTRALPTYQDTTYFDDIVSRHRRSTGHAQLDDGSPKVFLGDSNRTISYPATNNSWSVNQKSSLHEAPYTQDTSTTDAVKSTLRSLCGQTQAMPNHLDYKPYNPRYQLPPSLPSSPPPTYASAEQRSPRSETYPEDTKRHLSIDQPSHRSSRSSPSEVRDDAHNIQSVRKDTWAYTYPERHQAPAELAGNSFMSGTNSDGPVNPYAFHPTAPTPVPRPYAFEDSKIETLSELLGDVDLAVELPGNEPAHLSRHSLRLSWDTSNHGPPAHPAYKHEHPESVSELPAIPRRRPVISHTVSEPTAILNETSVTPPRFELDSVSSQTHPSLITRGQAGSGRHWSVSSVSSSPRPPTSINVSPNTVTYVAPLAPQASHGHERPLSSHAPQSTNNKSSARMRRQKHMLDLLDSIDR
ncbi:hypothetical protein BKA58DRAFT_60572 [Alternaria rosae]|uniref:uncharacterized protein n=1 Tax=Alternaria rosae TaxID=1187941 RepID=UPI001E8EAFC5|nr:uncharacterized protein BKA58DRAFT_60572 [Alternaria rosae]KAH6852834.1 hypothetical protein BKA58DRAFT_60572 [Alternaria rosae]